MGKDNWVIQYLEMFVKDAQICNYADDTTMYASDSNIEGVIATLESDAQKRRGRGQGGGSCSP